MSRHCQLLSHATRLIPSFHISTKVVFMPFGLKPEKWERKWRRHESSYLIGIINESLSYPFPSGFSWEFSLPVDPALFIFPLRQTDVFSNWPFTAPSAMPKHLAIHHKLPSAQVLFLFQMALGKIPVASRLSLMSGTNLVLRKYTSFAHSLLISQLLNISVSLHLNLLVGIGY